MTSLVLILLLPVWTVALQAVLHRRSSQAAESDGHKKHHLEVLVSDASRRAESEPSASDGFGHVLDWKTGRQRMMFLHIPKNAGTTIEEAAAKAHIWWPRKWLSFWHGLQMQDGSYCEKYHVPPRYLKELNDTDADVFGDSGSFCVTRHPYERAVSEYTYMLSVAWGSSMSELYGTGLYDKPKCSVAGLNSFLQKTLQVVSGGKKFVHDCHMVPQAEFIWGENGKKWCQNILRTDELPGSFNQLMASNGLKVRLATVKENNSTKICPSLSVESLTLQTRRLLDAAYAQDFQDLNYSTSNKPMVFMHIPKNAGESIAQAGLDQNITWPRTSASFAMRAQMTDGSWCDKYHVPPQHLASADSMVFERGDVFCITRHPYDRAISEFVQATASREGARMAAAYNVELPENATCTKDNLNNFLQSALKAMRDGKPYLLDCHMVPQHEFIWGPDGKQQCHTMVQYSGLPQALNLVMASKGYPDLKLGAKEPTNSSAALCPGLNRNSLTNETKTLLHQVYDEDFTRLGYHRAF